jgi:NADP-dependent 3-hydroxy acid dehydrogenase YdfG
MLQQGSGTMIFTGATASVKAGAEFAAFGASKFALRGFAQSLARELGPRGIHVAHVVIDGIIWSPRTRSIHGVAEQECLQPDAIARIYIHLIEQERSAWTQELDIRPNTESF